jgi:predicted anti-sigma-YlaC factor YlaD
MRCDEIQEHLIDLLYDERGPRPENLELHEHLRTCSACRMEFEELKQARRHLQVWKDEAPLQSVTIPKTEFLLSRSTSRHYLRYAAIAATLLICFLLFAGAEITLNRNGFSYRSHLFTRNVTGQNYYTKSEVRDLVKRALDDSEIRAGEINNVLARRILDAVERERWMDAHLQRTNAARDRN